MSRQSQCVIMAAHPELDAPTAQRMAEAYENVARRTGTVVSELAIRSRRAEQESTMDDGTTP